jgi:hypothetical protein
MFFHIQDWAACASGLYDKPAWLAWSTRPYPPTGDEVPAMSEMPAMHRRRLERVGRVALQVAYWCQSTEVGDIPLVFASRHGDIQRTYAMLEALARDEALSPTQFGLSIHNAIVAQYSIARALKRNYSAVAAGKSTAEAAVLEAFGLLIDGAEEVMIVMYDGLLPKPYRMFEDEICAEYAWAWRIRKATSDVGSFSLAIAVGADAESTSDSGLPHGLEVLRFMLSDDQSMDFHDGTRHWRWQRHV